ncbi:MAG TPA: CAP domain-containing protein [Rubrobacter sp.]|nr:CAP domain-containing protein [Rubrobacter sp.]
MRHLALLLVAVAVAVAATTFLATPPAAEAAGGGNVRKCGGGKIFLKADEMRVFALHNRERRERNLRALCVHPALERAARAHSKDMIRRDYFSHNTKGRNESSCQRVRRFGYRYSRCAENIAWGSGPKGEPDSIMRMWMGSNGHRANILDGKLREVGIGTYSGTFNGTRDATMYTADFGTRR